MATFTWIGGTLGAWGDAASWSGPGGVPGPTDIAIIPGADGTFAAMDLINGPGSAATLVAFDGVALNGSFVAQDVQVDQTGRLGIGNDDTLTTQTLNTAFGGQLTVNGGTLSVASTLTTEGDLLFRNGAIVRAEDFVVNLGTVTLDATASLNVGNAEIATPGMVIVDAGHSLLVDAGPRDGYFGVHGQLSGTGFLNNGTITGSNEFNTFSTVVAFTSGTNNGVMTGVSLMGAFPPDMASGPFVNNGTIYSGRFSSLRGVHGSGTVVITDQGHLTADSWVEALVDFSDESGTLGIGSSSLFFGFTGTATVDLTLRNFGTDDVIFLPFPVTGASYTLLGADLGRLTLQTGNGIIYLTVQGTYRADPQLEFATQQTVRLGPNGFFIGIVCFGPGTRILTTRGPIAVEDLRIGDRAVTPLSRTSRPIIWIGQRDIDLNRHPTARDMRPIRVRAGAFADQVPERDLYLSPNHAIHANGALIPIKHLVNGSSVTPVDMDRITYWHVELDQHDVLLAEGLATESYLDAGDRAFFANAGPVVT